MITYIIINGSRKAALSIKKNYHHLYKAKMISSHCLTLLTTRVLTIPLCTLLTKGSSQHKAL